MSLYSVVFVLHCVWSFIKRNRICERHRSQQFTLIHLKICLILNLFAWNSPATIYSNKPKLGGITNMTKVCKLWQQEMWNETLSHFWGQKKGDFICTLCFCFPCPIFLLSNFNTRLHFGRKSFWAKCLGS